MASLAEAPFLVAGATPEDEEAFAGAWQAMHELANATARQTAIAG